MYKLKSLVLALLGAVHIWRHAFFRDFGPPSPISSRFFYPFYPESHTHADPPPSPLGSWRHMWMAPTPSKTLKEATRRCKMPLRRRPEERNNRPRTVQSNEAGNGHRPRMAAVKHMSSRSFTSESGRRRIRFDPIWSVYITSCGTDWNQTVGSLNYRVWFVKSINRLRLKSNNKKSRRICVCAIFIKIITAVKDDLLYEWW